MRASIGSAASLSIGAPERLAAVGDAELVGIDRSGRLLVRRLPPQPTSIRVVLNWTRELRALLGPPPAWVPR